MGSEALARLTSRRLPSLGMLANLVEFPAVPKGQARFRLQVMARHSQHDIVDAVHRLATAAADAAEDLRALEEGTTSLGTLDRDRPLPTHFVEPEAQRPEAPAERRRGPLAA
jgi:glycine C-acetyltransferase